MKQIVITFILLVSIHGVLLAQKTEPDKDSIPVAVAPAVKDSAQLADSLRRAAIRRVTRHSAMVPGWGQIDNKQILKVPIIYGALGFTAFLFFDNVKTYRELRQAYILRLDTTPGSNELIPLRYRPLTTNSIRFNRDAFRQNVDYSVLAFLIIWGVNVVDATVFAHLRGFDVSDDLSLKLKMPHYNVQSGFAQVGVSLELKNKNKELKPLPGR